MRETVLYYAPENAVHVGLVKGVLVQMGIKIKNLTPGRCEKRIGFLAGMDGFEDDQAKEGSENSNTNINLEESGREKTITPEGWQQASHVEIKEELLVLCGFTEKRLDQLLEKLRKAGVPRSVMKAIVTETNAHWTVYELYDHLTKERRQMELR